MRKKIIVMAAVVLAAAGGFRQPTPGGPTAYKMEITDQLELVQAEAPDILSFETGEEATAHSGADEGAAAEEVAGEEESEPEPEPEPADGLEGGEEGDESTEGPEGAGETEPADELKGESGTVPSEKAEEPTAGGSAVAFTSLSPHEAVVRSYSELKNTLENNNGITTVYFGDDITMQATGVRINPNKVNVIIDGFNPLDPGQTQPHTLTDYRSLSFYDTVYIDAAGVETLLVRDLTITGKNYYGPFSVYDSSSLAGITVTYERVNYNGPQLCYNRRGTAHIIDCTVNIHGGNGSSESNEFSEAKHLLFEGTNTLHIETDEHSVFWIPAGGTLKIADDSSLLLTSPNTSTLYGVFYAGGSAYKVDITIGRRAVLDATISGVVAPGANVTLSSLTVQEDGEFYLSTTKTATAPVLKMGGAITVEKGATFIISGYGGASYAILRQESGDITVGRDATFHITAASANFCLLNLFGRAFICNDPASVLLYNDNRNILASSSTGRVYVNAQQVNYWNAVSGGGLDEPPRYRWEKADKTNFWFDGTLDVGDSGNFTALSSNYEPGDPPGSAPGAASFSMVDARVLAFGRLELVVTAPTTDSTSISGVTAPGATVRVSIMQQGTSYILPDVKADAEGVFHVPAGIPLVDSAVVTVKSNWRYLTATDEVVVRGEGRLEFVVPGLMEFFVTELTASTKTVERLNPDWKIVVSDTRGAGSGWGIYARLDREMAPLSANRPALEGALVFVDEIGNRSAMSTGTEILILRHTTAYNEEVFPVLWSHDKGILLTVKPGAAFADTVYTASISWTLVDAP